MNTIVEILTGVPCCCGSWINLCVSQRADWVVVDGRETELEEITGPKTGKSYLVGHKDQLIDWVWFVPDVLEVLSKNLCGQLLGPTVIVKRANTAKRGVGPVQKGNEFKTAVARGGSQGCMYMTVDGGFPKWEHVGRA